jgi:tetratricopeptide (TPR) repeat protein
MFHQKTAYAMLLIVLAASTSGVRGQSMTVLTTGEDAKNCSFAAERAAVQLASRSDLDPCNRAFELALLSRRDRAATYVNRGIVLAALGDYQAALNDYNEALEIQPSMPQPFIGKGNLYYIAERYAEAIAAYATALELKLPERHLALYNQGMTYEELNDLAAAERNYRAALEFVPDWLMAQDKLKRVLEQAAAPPAN